MTEPSLVQDGTRRIFEPCPVAGQVWPEEIEPMVSICCWAYNHELYIEQFIESVLMQKTDFPVEIIIHDDASRDRTTEILDKYQRQYPKLFRNIYQTQNQFSCGGDINAILFGRARGEFIALCEGDDYWTDFTKLQKQAEFLIENRHLSGVFHTGFAVNDLGKRIPFLWDNWVYEKEYNQIECLKNLRSGYPTSSLMFRAVAYPSKTPQYFREAASDFCLDIMLTEYGSLGFQDFEGSAYRQHSGGSWSTLTEAQMQASMMFRLIALYRDVELRKKYPELKDIVHKHLDIAWWQAFRNSLPSWFTATVSSSRLALRIGPLGMLQWLVRPLSPPRFKLRDLLLKKYRSKDRSE